MTVGARWLLEGRVTALGAPALERVGNGKLRRPARRHCGPPSAICNRLRNMTVPPSAHKSTHLSRLGVSPGPTPAPCRAMPGDVGPSRASAPFLAATTLVGARRPRGQHVLKASTSAELVRPRSWYIRRAGTSSDQHVVGPLPRQSRSMMVALAIPPPSHIVCRPYLPPVDSSVLRSVASSRVPEAPSG